ncbi:MAG: hypothetical protein ACE5F6_09365 [Anaerolineae bacterium]
MTRFYGWAAAAAIFLLLGMGLAGWRADQTEWRQWQRRFHATHPDQPIDTGLRSLTPTLTGQPELCTTCHVGLAEISESHPVESFGCVVCHGGNGLALDRKRAHAGLLGGRNPSDFSVVAQTCGQSNCHSGYDNDHADQNQVDRVLRSLQATYAGGIALVRFTFGAQSDQTARYGAVAAIDPDPPAGWVSELDPLPVSSADDLSPELAAQGVTVSNHPIDTRFRRFCLDGGCHLSEPATPQPYRYRSTGCVACHYIYGNDGLYQGDDPTIPRDEPGHGRRHQLTTAVPFYQCNHCHNRGNYSLRSMTFAPRPDLPPAGKPLSPFLSRQQRRLAEYYQPIGQFTLCEWELDCVDCHTSDEAMGNGHIAGRIADSQVTECRTCHGTLSELPQTAPITDPDERAMRQARLNGRETLHVGDRVVVTSRGEKLWAVKEVAPGRFAETLKVSGEILEVPLVYGSACQQQPDQQASRYCHACHAYPRDKALEPALER